MKLNAVLVLLVFGTVAPSYVLGISCYSCISLSNSTSDILGSDPLCADPFSTEKGAKFHKSCSAKQNRCGKITATIKLTGGDKSQTAVFRGCIDADLTASEKDCNGFLNNIVSGVTFQASCSYCDTDYCNGASAFTSLPAMTGLLAAALILVVNRLH